MQSSSDPMGGTSGGGGLGGAAGTGGLGGGTTGGAGGLGGGTAGGSGDLGGGASGGGGGLSGGSTGGGYGGSGAGTGGLGGGADADFGAGMAGGGGGLGDGSPALDGSTGSGTGGDTDFATAEPVYRRHYEALDAGTSGSVAYEEARGGYELGHTAAANPAYAERGYEEVEVDLRTQAGDTGRYDRVREYTRHAFEWKRVLAGVALVAGGYWASKKLFQAVSELNEEDERDCRTYYESHAVRTGGVPYNQARTVYVLGYAAARNPDYTGRTYDDVEPHLRTGYTGSRAGSYDALRDFGRRGYERGTTRGGLR